MIHNHPILSLLVLTLAVPFLFSCTTAPPPDTTAEDSQAIRAASKQWEDNFDSGDLAAFATHYTEEAKVLPPNNQIVTGRESIQEFFQAFYDAGGRDLHLTVIDLHVSGDMAHDVGKYTLTIKPEEGEAISDSGKFVTIWKRENATWKIDVDIFNTSVPLPVPEALPTTEEEE